MSSALAGSTHTLSELTRVVPLIGFVLTLVFFSADHRCYQVICDMRNLGKALEKKASLKGVYEMAVELAPKNFFAHIISHTWILRLFYGLTALFLLIASVTLYGQKAQGVRTMSEFSQVATAVLILTFFSRFIIVSVGLAVVYLGYKLYRGLYEKEDTIRAQDKACLLPKLVPLQG
jgi:hypothetical protein